MSVPIADDASERTDQAIDAGLPNVTGRHGATPSLLHLSNLLEADIDAAFVDLAAHCARAMAQADALAIEAKVAAAQAAAVAATAAQLGRDLAGAVSGQAARAEQIDAARRIDELAAAVDEGAKFDLGLEESARDARAAFAKVHALTSNLRATLIAALRHSDAGNRRQDRRVPVRIDAVLRVGRVGLRGAIQDLSNGGALFHSGWTERHSEVSARSQGEISIGELAAIDVAVVSISQSGIHLKFENVPTEIAAWIRRQVMAAK